MDARISSKVIGYGERWPRAVFNLRRGKNRLVLEARDLLKKPGVYVLYRDDEPYYVGRTNRPLYDRIYDHANKPRDAYYRYWNYFSAFLVDSEQDRKDIESILIAAIPRAANSSSPKLDRIELPRVITEALARHLRITIPDRHH